ncbi:MAG TPA: hypothetical protein VHX42_02235 [Candidatus Babeliales bacterium]|nr:hypothetical protein [Candidatus Babeliales bacterium]
MMLACLFLIAFIPFTIIATPQTSEMPTIETVQSEPTSTEPVAQPSSITINNNIKSDMLTYKHWTGKYNPDSFKVFVNDTEVAQGSSLELPSETKTVNLKFDYSFVKGTRTGSKTVSYKLNEDVTQADITFSWDNENKIMIDNGTAVAS